MAESLQQSEGCSKAKALKDARESLQIEWDYDAAREACEEPQARRREWWE